LKYKVATLVLAVLDARETVPLTTMVPESMTMTMSESMIVLSL